MGQPVRLVASQTADLLREARRLEATGDEVDARLARAICWQVVVLNDGLARRFAKCWGTGGEDDRLQVARLGLLRAAGRWDPARGCSFSTLAHWWCRAILVREMPALRLKARAVGVLAAIKRAEDDGYSGAALAERCGLSRRSLDQHLLMRRAQDHLSTDAVIAGTGGLRLVDTLGATPALDEIDHPRVRRAVQRLPTLERRVLVARFGLDGDEPMSLDQTGRLVERSREWVRLIEYRALARLRSHLGVQAVVGKAPSVPDPVVAAGAAEFAGWCRAERSRLGLSQRLMSERLSIVLGVSIASAETNLSRLETGRTRPRARWREAIERILKAEAEAA